MLGQTRAKVLGLGRFTVHLDDARTGSEPREETEAIARALPRRIGLVSEVGLLGLRVDRVLRDSGTEGAECSLTDLLGEFIEPIAHEAWPTCHTDA
jgi:hypothetical protein